MKTAGYTLLELIIVIIILGVLAVSAYSRFAGKDGVVEYTYQARLISSLRAMQMRAMQDTRDGYCFQVNLSAAAFGPPDFTHTAPGNPNLAYKLAGSAAEIARTCSTAIGSLTPDYLRTNGNEMAEEGLSLDGIASINHIGFDSLGRPVNNSNPANPVAQCTSGCRIDIKGVTSAGVCIEPQGYIHACP